MADVFCEPAEKINLPLTNACFPSRSGGRQREFTFFRLTDWTAFSSGGVASVTSSGETLCKNRRSLDQVPSVVGPPAPLSANSLSTPISSSSAAPTTAVVAPATHINITHNPDTTKNINIATAGTRHEDLDYTCPHCDRSFTSHVGVVGHFRTRRTETGEPVLRAPTYIRRIRLHCPHCPCTFMHRMGLFGHMRIRENLR
ncbi:hypothetical protein SprV_0200771200 [Sparganum proliferum]